MYSSRRSFLQHLHLPGSRFVYAIRSLLPGHKEYTEINVALQLEVCASETTFRIATCFGKFVRLTIVAPFHVFTHTGRWSIIKTRWVTRLH